MRIFDPRLNSPEEVAALFRKSPPKPGERLKEWCRRNDVGLDGPDPMAALRLMQVAAEQAGVHFGWVQ